MLKKILAGAAMSLLAASSYAATPTAFYGGLDVGSTKINDLSGHKTSVGGFLGYGLNQNFAVELGYRQLGSWDFGPIGVDVKQTHLSLVGAVPLNERFDLYGRLGYNKLSGEASYQGIRIGDSDNGVMYGVGLNYSFTPAVSGRFEVQKPSSDTTNIGVAVAFKF